MHPMAEIPHKSRHEKYETLLGCAIVSTMVLNTVHCNSGLNGLQTTPAVFFTKEVNPRLAKRPLKTKGRLAYCGLTSLVKEATEQNYLPIYWLWASVAYFTKEVNTSLAKLPLISMAVQQNLS